MMLKARVTLRWISIISLSILGASAAGAAESDDKAELLIQKMKQVVADPGRYAEAVKRGEQRVVLCQYCHGKNGISKRDNIPNLAAQHVEYLIRQFELFDGQDRVDPIMSELAGTLSDEERINVALFYSSQPPGPGHRYDEGDKNIGKKIYHDQCAACHGQEGYGNDQYPRIAGQQGRYLVRTLARYRSDEHLRPNSPMQAIAKPLTNEQIKSLAAYISGLK
jgi:cytochrome c553